MRTMAVVLMDEGAAADVRVGDAAACVSLEGTRPVGVGAGELPLLLPLLLVAGACEVGAGASDVGAGSSEVAGGAEGAGGGLEAGGGDDAGGGGGGDEVAGGAGEGVGVLPPVPEACRFSLWWRYSLMPSMCRPSKLKAEAMATKASSVTNSQAWRNMVMSGEGKQRAADVVEAADGCGAIYWRLTRFTSGG